MSAVTLVGSLAVTVAVVFGKLELRVHHVLVDEKAKLWWKVQVSKSGPRVSFGYMFRGLHWYLRLERNFTALDG